MHILQLETHNDTQNATQDIHICCLIKLSKQTHHLFLAQMHSWDIGV